MDLFHFLYSYIFLTEHNPCLFFLAHLQGWYAALLIHYSILLSLFLHFLSFLWLISCSDPPQWTLFTLGLLHVLPIAFSVLFYSFTSLELACMFIILYVHLFAHPSLPMHACTHTRTHTYPIFPFTLRQSPLAHGTVSLPHERVIRIA